MQTPVSKTLIHEPASMPGRADGRPRSPIPPNRRSPIGSPAVTRRAFLKTAGAIACLLRSQAARAARGVEAEDDEILAKSRAGIEQHRKSDVLLLLRSAAGEPVSRADVLVEQTRHDFLFGCNFFMFDRLGEAEREAAYREQFRAVFNYATLGFYWANYERQQGSPNYDYTDRVVDYCLRHGITCKGHPLVWDNPAGSPSWLPEDAAAIQRLSQARVRDIVTRYKGRIEYWDVVNEPTHLPEGHNRTRMAQWGRTTGPVEYVAQHLQVAREANPAATLLVNDYRLDMPYYRILERLRTGDGPAFDAVGLQSHMHGGVWPLRKARDTADLYAQLGRPLHFTEITILSGSQADRDGRQAATTPEGEQRQAEQTARFYTTLFAHPAVRAMTWWDFSDAGAWQRAPAGWLRRDMTRKPVYDRMHKLIKGDWWTRVQATPDPRGCVALRAFHGTHRVTIVLPSGQKVHHDIHVKAGEPNRFELKLA